MTQKIRGGRAILEDLKLVSKVVRDAGRDNIDYATNARLMEDAGKDLLRAARELDRLIEVLEPMLERIEHRAQLREIQEISRRLEAVEEQVAQLNRDQRGITRLPDRKQEGR